jgi:hypothetical protein
LATFSYCSRLTLIIHDNKEFYSGRSPRALNESMSEELKYALGEKKYQAFLEKSMKDIEVAIVTF